jgi:hypothetical protein
MSHRSIEDVDAFLFHAEHLIRRRALYYRLVFKHLKQRMSVRLYVPLKWLSAIDSLV